MAGRGQSFLVDSHPEKQKIVDGILAGKSVRSIAKSVSPPLEFNAIQRYKVKVVRPMLLRAERISAAVHPVVPLSDPIALQTAREAIQDAPAVSTFRRRLEKLHGRIDRSLDKAESAVRVQRDEDGNEVFAGVDLSPIAPLINQAHKNLEMLGRATGELEPQGTGSVSIQIVTSSAAGELPRVSFATPDQLELAAAPEEDVDPIAEIGILQRR